MGKQTSFYMTEQDEDEFLAFVRSTGDVVILPGATNKEHGEEFISFRELTGRPLGEDCFLWNRSISPPPIVEYFEAHGGCYCVDLLDSEVVQVTRSKLTGQTLHSGRLYIEHIMLCPDGTLAEKSAEFQKWFERLRRWIRKTYPHRFNDAYVSARAEALAETGVELF